MRLCRLCKKQVFLVKDYSMYIDLLKTLQTFITLVVCKYLSLITEVYSKEEFITGILKFGLNGKTYKSGDLIPTYCF